MTILCCSSPAASLAIKAALPAPVTLVATLAEAGEILDREPGERLVVVGIDVPFNDTLAFTSITGARHPAVGVVVIRPELELSEVQQGMRSGVRDIIQVDDLTGLSDACARSLELSGRTVPGVRAPSGGPVEGKIITVFSAKGGVGKTTISTNLSMGEIQPAELSTILTSYRPNHDCLLAPVAPGDAERIPASLTTTLLSALSKLYDYVVVDTPSQLSEH